jgi:hypothetical protein
MSATVKLVSIYADLIVVDYSDNGTSDRITKSFPDPVKGIEWLKLWYSDTGNGIQHIDRAIETLKEQI